MPHETDFEAAREIFDAKKHRAKLRAEFEALCSADKKAWATGQAIAEAYAQAMLVKRALRFGRRSLTLAP